MNNNTQKFSDLFNALPEVVQSIIYDGPLDKELSDIAKKYNISEIDIKKIKGYVLLIIIGLDKSETLEQTILQDTAIEKQNVKEICDEIIQKIILPLAAERTENPNPDKEALLNEIENPIPTRPIVRNPAGQNTILDAQHNLPEQEKKVLIGSSAVPSRGPMLGNFKIQPISRPVQPIQSPPSTVIPQAAQQSQFVRPTRLVPPVQSVQPVQPIQSTQPTQIPKMSQIPKLIVKPAPSAPSKYSVDPYREPAE